MQSSLGKISAVSSSRVTKALDVSSGSKSPSAGAKEFERRRKAFSLKGSEILTEGPSSSNEYIDFDSVYAEVLYVSLLK